MSPTARLRPPLLAALGWVLAFASPSPLSANPFRGSEERLSQSAVQILTDSGSGSGFFVSAKGHIVTNHHVVDGASAVYVLRRNDRANTIECRKAEVLWKKMEPDLAILKVDGMVGKPLAIRTDDVPSQEPVCAVGFPGIAMDDEGLRQLVEALKDNDFADVPIRGEFGDSVRLSLTSSTTTTGVRKGYSGAAGSRINELSEKEVLNLIQRFLEEKGRAPANVDEVVAFYLERFDIEKVSLVYHDAATSPGNSGGALINECFQVVGIVDAGLTDIQSLAKVNIAIASSELVAALRNQKIPFNSTGTPCNAAFAANAMTWSLIGSVGVLSVVAILLTLRRPVRERIGAGFTRLMGGRPAYAQPHPGGPGPVAPPYPPHRPDPLPAPGAHPPASAPFQTVRLDGRDPEGRVYRLEIPASRLLRDPAGVILGRNGQQADYEVAHERVSRRHAVLTLAGSTLSVTDLDSANGTWVNGRKLERERSRLQDGDELRIGHVTFRVRLT
jgi:hypothetical protein